MEKQNYNIKLVNDNDQEDVLNVQEEGYGHGNARVKAEAKYSVDGKTYTAVEATEVE